MSGRWRQRLTGGLDEFSEKGPALTIEQREHLTRVTDELLQRYSISRSVGSDGTTGGVAGEPISADEIGAVLESVLVEAFDFGWFTRSDLPEAPELAFESEGTDWERPPAGGGPDRGFEPVEWSDPLAAEDEAAADWSSGLGSPRPSDPEPESELVAEPEPEDDPSDMMAVAAIEVAELEEIHRAAVAAERDAILFAAATRQRLAEARQALAQAQASSPE